MKWIVSPSVIAGSTEVPGDKSIGHRALMVGALAHGQSRVSNLSTGADVLATAACLRELGVRIDSDVGGTVMIAGDGLFAAGAPLDAANSGTTMRLLSGILAAQGFDSVLTGDDSLRRRPMRRVIEPLERMGASIQAHNGRAPLRIAGRALHGIRYELPVASAQVKSAIVLAGLFADGETEVLEPLPTRDHTERLLSAVGVPIERRDGSIRLRRGAMPQPFNLEVPGDISSAAFLFVAAAILDSSVEVGGVGVNPLRTGILDALQAMGTSVELRNRRCTAGNEPVADVRVSGRPTRPLVVEAADVPRLIDELPLIALLGAYVAGDTVVSGAAELRVKETDRIDLLARELRALGVSIEDRPDGFVVHGRAAPRGGYCNSHGDHRLAMLLAVAGLAASGVTVIAGAESAAVSFPGFAATLRLLGGAIGEQ